MGKNRRNSIDNIEKRGERFKKHFLDFPLYIHPYSQNDMNNHSHDFLELVYIRQGSGIHRISKEKYPIFAGDCFLILPGIEHGYEDTHNLKLVNICFYSKIMNPFINDLVKIKGFNNFFSIEPFFREETSFQYKLHIKQYQQVKIRRIIHKIYTEIKNQKEGYKIFATGLFLQLLCLISRYYESNINSENITADFNNKQKIVEKAISYLEEKYDKKISLDELAYTVCMSVSHLSYTFKETTGMTLIDYLTRIRVEQARELLSKKNSNITEISFEVGFHDSSYFARVFKKYYGISPTEYRKKTKLV